jgi:PST family polysaccharide transporter
MFRLTEKYSSVLRSATWLTVLSSASYLIPLFTVPYIIRKVGIELYGEITFALAITAVFVVLVDYGFTLTATKDISILANDINGQSLVFSCVLTIKLILLIAGFIVLLLIASMIPRLHEYRGLLIAAYITVVGNALAPVWFFQGIERMSHITICTLLGQIVYLAMLQLLIKTKSDYMYIPISQGMGLVAGGLLGLSIAFKKYHIRLRTPTRSDLFRHIKESWEVFLSRVFLNLYTSANLVLLGFLSTPTEVGQYAVAEKIRNVFLLLPNAANQALFPSMAKKSRTLGRGEYSRFVQHFTKMFLVFGSTSAIIAFAASKEVVSIVNGKESPKIELLVKIISMTLILKPLGALYTNALIVEGLSKTMKNILGGTAIVSVILSIPAISLVGAQGLAWVALATNTSVILLCRDAYIRAIKETS